MFKIHYNGTNPFQGLSPTPFVERQVSAIHYGKKHCNSNSFTLRGTITGDVCQDGNEFVSFYNKANTLFSRFSPAFKDFSIIYDDGVSDTEIFAEGSAIVRGITIDEGAFAGFLPFSVNLDVFEEGSFDSNYGILDPSQEVKFQESEDGSISVTQVTSARGFNTTTGALPNAISFVQSITGLNTGIHPSFMSMDNFENAILVSVNENIDRLTATYSVEESWVYDPHGRHGLYSVYKTQTSIDSGVDGIEVGINGQIIGGMDATMEQIDSDFALIDQFSIVSGVYGSVASGDLYSEPVSRQINRKPNDKSIDFTFIYSDKIKSDPYINDSLSISWESDSNKTCVSSQITIKSVDPCLSARWAKVNNFYLSFSTIDWLNEKLAALGYDLSLPGNLKSSSTSYDEKNGIISLNAAVCEKKIIVPAHFSDFTYTVEIRPAMPIFRPFQGLDMAGEHTIQKLNGKTRRSVTIQGEGIIKSCSSKEDANNSLITHMNNLKLQYLNLDDTYMLEKTIKNGTGDSSKRLSFSFAWNEDGEIPFADNLLFSNPPPPDPEWPTNDYGAWEDSINYQFNSNL